MRHNTFDVRIHNPRKFNTQNNLTTQRGLISVFICRHVVVCATGIWQGQCKMFNCNASVKLISCGYGSCMCSQITCEVWHEPLHFSRYYQMLNFRCVRTPNHLLHHRIPPNRVKDFRAIDPNGTTPCATNDQKQLFSHSYKSFLYRICVLRRWLNITFRWYTSVYYGLSHPFYSIMANRHCILWSTEIQLFRVDADWFCHYSMMMRFLQRPATTIRQQTEDIRRLVFLSSFYNNIYWRKQLSAVWQTEQKSTLFLLYSKAIVCSMALVAVDRNVRFNFWAEPNDMESSRQYRMVNNIG